MFVKAIIGFAVLTVLVLNKAIAADLNAGKAMVFQGNGAAGTACIACHGAEGAGNAAAGFPRLAGLNAAYLVKQLQDFQRGTRKDAVMQPVAQRLTAAEVADVAAYFAAQSPPTTTAADDASRVAQGQRIALNGVWEKDIPACISCHGPGGRGVGAHFPALAGQHAGYLVQQLKAWRSRTRNNDPQDLMKGIAQRLTAPDIVAVSAYFASLAAVK